MGTLLVDPDKSLPPAEQGIPSGPLVCQDRKVILREDSRAEPGAELFVIGRQ
jgi:hypothetical protein